MGYSNAPGVGVALEGRAEHAKLTVSPGDRMTDFVATNLVSFV